MAQSNVTYGKSISLTSRENCDWEFICPDNSLPSDGIRPGSTLGCFPNATGRFIQPRSIATSGLTQNESSDLLRAARTIFIWSGTVYLRPELLETALRGREDFQSLDLAIVRDREAADLVIDFNRPLFTFEITYSVTHRQSSRLVASGKVTAFDGNGAAPKIARELIRQMQSARVQR